MILIKNKDSYPLGLLSSDTIVDYGFRTRLTAKDNKSLNDLIFLGNNEIKRGYTLAREYGIKKSSNNNKAVYGYLGSDKDTFYIEAYCKYDAKGTVISNEMRINANIYCPNSEISYTDSNNNTIEIKREDLFDYIVKKWSNIPEGSTTAVPFQGDDKDLFGMKVNVSVNINEVVCIEDKDGESPSKPAKRKITVKGRTAIEDYDGEYITMNLFDSNLEEKNSITHSGLSSFPEIEIYNTHRTKSGEFDYKSGDEFKATAAHEFGHVLGLMDAYGFDNKENYYMEPVSYGEVIYDENGAVGHEESGEMMHRSGKVSSNDIEMAIYAKKENMSRTKYSNTGYQFYVPLGRIMQNDNSYDLYGLSKAIRCIYYYRCKKDTHINYNGQEFDIHKDMIYYFNGFKYILLDSTKSVKEDIMECFGPNFDEDYYNYALSLLPDDGEEEDQ